MDYLPFLDNIEECGWDTVDSLIVSQEDKIPLSVVELTNFDNALNGIIVDGKVQLRLFT